MCRNDDGDADGYGRRIVTIEDDGGWPTWWQEVPATGVVAGAPPPVLGAPVAADAASITVN